MPTQKQFKYKYPNEGRWDHRKNRWITAAEDFDQMYQKAVKMNPGLTKEQLYANFQETAAEDVPGISQFCKYIISGDLRVQNAP